MGLCFVLVGRIVQDIRIKGTGWLWVIKDMHHLPRCGNKDKSC